MTIFVILCVVTLVLSVVALICAFLAVATSTSSNPNIRTGDTAPRPCCVENYCRTPHKDQDRA